MSIASFRQSSSACCTSGWSGISRSPGRFSAQAIWSGNTEPTRSSAAMRMSCGGTLWPPRKRGRASDTPLTQRQRVVNIGKSSTAWINTPRAVLELR